MYRAYVRSEEHTNPTVIFAVTLYFGGLLFLLAWYRQLERCLLMRMKRDLTFTQYYLPMHMSVQRYSR